jgi:hypothetical protein
MRWETGSTEVFDFSKVPQASIMFILNLMSLGSKPIGEVRTFPHAMNNL